MKKINNYLNRVTPHQIKLKHFLLYTAWALIAGFLLGFRFAKL